ncbi:MAG: pyruvate dehydrogenase [Actinomycetota bacterium]|nr:pyruvate dehydrogenase [Actinomycetota bacterium]
MSETVADQLIEVLLQANVRRIYGVVGDSLNPVVDAVRRAAGIEWVSVRNEEAGAFAAAAEAQVTGTLAVCAGSAGPGNTHLIQGLYDAHRSGVPVLALAAHIPTAQIGTGFFQETHPERLFIEASGYCELVSQAGQMPRLARIAVQHAVGASEVAVLVLPGDVGALAAAGPAAHGHISPPAATPQPDPSQVAALAGSINAAATVTLFCGAGARAAHAEVMELASRVKAPVAHTLRGKEWIQYDNPFDVGMSGLLGYGAAYEAMHEADLLLLLGTDFPYDSFLPGAHTIQIDRDPTHLGRRTPLDLGVHGDARETLRAVLPLVEEKAQHAFLDSMLRDHARALEHAVDAYTKNIDHHRPVHPEYLASVIDDVASDDAVFTVDTGMCNVWAARYLTPNGRRRVIGSFLHGSMANALPHAIGAQSANPDRQVISMSGDGGLSMLLGELITVTEHELPVKIVVFNNSSLGMVQLEMMAAGYPHFQTELPSIDFAAVAAALGIHSVRITEPADLRDALTEALTRSGPALIDVDTDANALSMPPNVTAAQVRGFALAAGRTVLDGGVGKMVELARANLRYIPRP